MRARARADTYVLTIRDLEILDLGPAHSCLARSGAAVRNVRARRGVSGNVCTPVYAIQAARARHGLDTSVLSARDRHYSAKT